MAATIYPQKRRAWWAVDNAKRRGALKRLPCVKCGDKNTHAHHADYSRRLDVVWMCPKHHQEHHDVHGRAPHPRLGGSGVTWHRGCRKWQAQVSIRGRVRYLGLFSTKSAALTAAASARDAVQL